MEISVSKEVRMQFTREKKLNAFNIFLGANGVDPALAFVHPIGIRIAEKPIEKSAPPGAPYTSDTGELVYDKAGRTYIIRAAKVYPSFLAPSVVWVAVFACRYRQRMSSSMRTRRLAGNPSEQSGGGSEPH